MIGQNGGNWPIGSRTSEGSGSARPRPLWDNFPKRRAAPLKENSGICKKYIGCCPTNASPPRYTLEFWKRGASHRN